MLRYVNAFTRGRRRGLLELLACRRATFLRRFGPVLRLGSPSRIRTSIVLVQCQESCLLDERRKLNGGECSFCVRVNAAFLWTIISSREHVHRWDVVALDDWFAAKDSNLDCLIQSQVSCQLDERRSLRTIRVRAKMVRMGRFELPRPFGHRLLRTACLPVPPHPRGPDCSGRQVCPGHRR